jgi:hypothetical protein
LDLWYYLGDTLFNKMTAQPQRQTRKPTGNMGFALWGLTYFVETFVQGSTFVFRMNSNAKTPPHLHKAQTVKNKGWLLRRRKFNRQ